MYYIAYQYIAYTLTVNAKISKRKQIFLSLYFLNQSLTGRKRTIRPKFDQVEYRPNAGLTHVKFRPFFLAQLGCQSSQIRKEYSAIIWTKLRQNLAKIRRSLDLNFQAELWSKV